MNKAILTLTVTLLTSLLLLSGCSTSATGGSGGMLTPKNGKITIPVANISDGKAHHFKVKADDGTVVTFFTLKSGDGVIRAAIDACDVCFKSGKGYYQEGDKMVCQNCGQKFASNKINVIKGGCNPAPLRRKIEGNNLVIAMQDVNANKWYMQYRQ